MQKHAKAGLEQDKIFTKEGLEQDKNLTKEGLKHDMNLIREGLDQNENLTKRRAGAIANSLSQKYFIKTRTLTKEGLDHNNKNHDQRRALAR